MWQLIKNPVWQNRFAGVSILGVILLAWYFRIHALAELPPGIDRDTADNGVYALHILYDGARPFFILRMGAAQPIILYLQALSVAFVGNSIFALRLVTAMIGTLSIPSLYALVRALRFPRRVAVLAAFGLAVSLEHVYLSRLGLRAIFIPLCETLLLLFFWRALEMGRVRYWVAAGLTLGFSFYTYLSAFVFPVLLIVLAMYALAANREQLRLRWQSFAAFFVTLVVMSVPLVVLPFLYPAATFSRVGAVSLVQNPVYQKMGLLGVVGLKLLGEAKMFGLEWAGQYNPFSQPLLDPFWFVLFLVGVVLALYHFRRFEYGWAVLTIGVMFVPDILGGNELYPHELRAIGIIPPAFFLCGVGLVALLNRVPSRAHVLAYAAAAILLLTSTVHTYDLFFHQLGTPERASLDPDYNMLFVKEGEWLAQSTEPVLVPLNEFARQPVHFLAGARSPYFESALDANGELKANLQIDRARVLLPAYPELPRTEGKIYVDDPALFVLLQDKTAYLLPPLEASAVTKLKGQLEGAPMREIREPNGRVAARVYSPESPGVNLRFGIPPPITDVAHFGDFADVMGYDLSDIRAVPGQTIDLTLLWRVNRAIDVDNAIFIHLLDAQNNVIANYDVIPGLGAYPTWLWKPNEVLATHHLLHIPNRAKPGRYTLEIGLYNVLDGERMDRVNDKGESVDSRLVVGQVKIAPAIARVYAPTHSQWANFDNQIELLGYDLQTDDAPRSYRLALYWKALSSIPRDYTIFVHVLDSQGNIVA
ncbi:MAG TPA: glycosyltransferase family 39 protein, partial [Anaerolineae bacterium]|nr:glycosyltransferase family 39 protein [Anaerolineae bacterium]